MAKASNENAGPGGIDDNHDLMALRRSQCLRRLMCDS